MDLKKHENIAQIILLPYVIPGLSDHLRVGGFKSTNPDVSVNSLIIFTTKLKEEHSMKTFEKLRARNLKVCLTQTQRYL